MKNCASIWLFTRNIKMMQALCVSVHIVVSDGVFCIVYRTILMCLPTTVSLQHVCCYSQILTTRCLLFWSCIHRASSCFACFLFIRNECTRSVSCSLFNSDVFRSLSAPSSGSSWLVFATRQNETRTCVISMCCKNSQKLPEDGVDKHQNASVLKSD